MASSTLVALDVEAGRNVLAALESSGVELTVALWVITPEYDDGRIVIASKSLDQQQPIKAYRKVVEVLDEHSITFEPPILILRLRDPFITALRKVFGKTSSVEGMRLGGQSFGNRYITDGYVYQIK